MPAKACATQGGIPGVARLICMYNKQPEGLWLLSSGSCMDSLI